MKTLFLCILLFIATLASAQTLSFKATHQAIRYTNPFTNQFTDFGEWFPNEDSIVISFPMEKIIIYSRYPTQIFTILRPPFSEKTYNKDILLIDCEDGEDGIPNRCIMELVHYFDEEGKQLYIRWDKIQLVYQLKL